MRKFDCARQSVTKGTFFAWNKLGTGWEQEARDARCLGMSSPSSSSIVTIVLRWKDLEGVLVIGTSLLFQAMSGP